MGVSGGDHVEQQFCLVQLLADLEAGEYITGDVERVENRSDVCGDVRCDSDQAHDETSAPAAKDENANAKLRRSHTEIFDRQKLIFGTSLVLRKNSSPKNQQQNIDDASWIRRLSGLQASELSSNLRHQVWACADCEWELKLHTESPRLNCVSRVGQENRPSPPI